MGDALLKIIKFLLGVLLLPISVACVLSFYHHLGKYPEEYEIYLMWGACAFFIIFLFFYQFFHVQEVGRKLTAGMFKVLAPFNMVVANCIPIYTTIILLVFFGVDKIFKDGSHYNHYFLFFAGFTLVMHILLTAQELQINEQNLAKPHYLLIINFVVVVSLALAVLLLDLTSSDWTFPKFAEACYEHAKDYYTLAFEKIILLK